MIYTITTNPSLDYTVETDLVPGQINRTRSEAPDPPRPIPARSR